MKRAFLLIWIFALILGLTTGVLYGLNGKGNVEQSFITREGIVKNINTSKFSPGDEYEWYIDNDFNLTRDKILELSDTPTYIEFTAEEIIFRDKDIKIVWNESEIVGIDIASFKKMIFNIGNKSFVYTQEAGE